MDRRRKTDEIRLGVGRTEIVSKPLSIHVSPSRAEDRGTDSGRHLR